MNKKIIWALVLIAVVVIVLIVNRDTMDLNLLVTQVKAIESVILLAFTAIGVVVGLLLK